MNPRLPVFVLLLSSIGWGLTWWPVKQLNAQGLDSLWMIAVAFVTGVVVLLPWLYVQRSQWQSKTGFMLGIALAGGVANVAFQLAIYYGDIIRVMILFYLLPVWSVIGGRIFLGERLDTLRIIAVLICLSGALIILDVSNVALLQTIGWIDLMAIASGVSLAITNILFRSVLDIPLMSKISFMFLGSSVLIVLALLFFRPAVPDVAASVIVMTMLYGAIWLLFITLGTQWAVTKMEAGRSSIILVTELVVAVVSAALIAEHYLQWHEMVGGVLVLVAAVLEGLRSEHTALVSVPSD